MVSTPIRLHHCHGSRSARTLWLLEELGVDYDLVVYPFDGALRQPSYLEKSPAGRVPALELGGQVLFETGAIAQVLCETYPEAGLGREVGSSERADWLVWLHFAETLSQMVANLSQQHIFLREDWMRSPTITKLEAARLGKGFDAVEARLKGRTMLLDGGFSAADVAVGQAVHLGLHFVQFGDRPALSAWMKTLMARPAFQASLPSPGEGLYAKDFYAALDVVPPS